MTVQRADWGCQEHWYKLPVDLRNKISDAYWPGAPTEAYKAVLKEVGDWIAEEKGGSV